MNFTGEAARRGTKVGQFYHTSDDPLTCRGGQFYKMWWNTIHIFFPHREALGGYIAASVNFELNCIHSACAVSVYVTVHDRKSVDFGFYLRTKCDRHSLFTFRDIATFIHGRRKSTIAETAIFVRLRVILNVSGYASAYFLVETHDSSAAAVEDKALDKQYIRSNKKCSTYKRKVQK